MIAVLARPVAERTFASGGRTGGRGSGRRAAGTQRAADTFSGGTAKSNGGSPFSRWVTGPLDAVSATRVVGAVCCTGGMAFVHGHARETGWVVAHVRPPVEAEEDQLALVEVPPPDEPEPEISARNSAITRS
jgi:hypothetical protein